MFDENTGFKTDTPLNSLDGSNIFPDIENDQQFMSLMQEPGFWDKYDNDPEVQRKVTAYISQNEKKPYQPKDLSGMGMSAYKDVTGFAQETPIQGLMGMAQYNNAPKRGLMG